MEVELKGTARPSYTLRAQCCQACLGGPTILVCPSNIGKHKHAAGFSELHVAVPKARRHVSPSSSHCFIPLPLPGPHHGYRPDSSQRQES